jgi:Holliday junction resolvase RusA-like endonuclease
VTESELGGDYFSDMVLDQMLRWPVAMSAQHFWIPGPPVPNERPRIISRGGKSWAFTPAATQKARQHILNCVLQQKRRDIPPPYSVAFKFILSPDQKDSDVDNLIKCALDAVFSNKKSIPAIPFKDDKYIQNLVCFKRQGAKAGFHMWVMPA